MISESQETHYEVLGVPQSASQEEIRSAYLKLVALYHPDKHSGNPLQDLAQQKLARINVAYEVLSDSKRRAEYDAFLGRAGAGMRAGEAPHQPIHWVFKLLGVVALGLLLVRLIRPLFRFIAARSGTPLKLVIAVALLSGAVYWWLRRRRSR
jgi:hypothetical protein